jgi:hypothetical protein
MIRLRTKVNLKVGYRLYECKKQGGCPSVIDAMDQINASLFPIELEIAIKLLELLPGKFNGQSTSRLIELGDSRTIQSRLGICRN